MRKLVSISTLAVAGAVTTGLIAFQTPASADEDAAFRKDDNPDVVMAVDDDDDDDTFGRDGDTRTRTNGQTRTNGGDTNTGASRSTRDGTNSRFTGVSRDRDLSRSDKTKDWTRDGGDRTRDHSANQTNDRSRNDTRR